MNIRKEKRHDLLGFSKCWFCIYTTANKIWLFSKRLLCT